MWFRATGVFNNLTWPNFVGRWDFKNYLRINKHLFFLKPMKVELSKRPTTAFSALDLLMCIGAIVVIGALLLPLPSHSKARARRIACVNNLKQVGIGFRIAEMSSYPSYDPTNGA